MSPTLRSLCAWSALAVCATAPLAGAQSKMNPLPPIAVDPIVPMQLQHQKRAVPLFESVRLVVPATPQDGFTMRVPWDGALHDLDVRLFDVRADNYRLIAARDGGVYEEMDPGAIHTFRGTVRDDKDAIVAGATLVSGMQAVILLGDGRRLEIEPDFEAFARGDREAFIVFDAANVVLCCESSCQVDESYRIGLPPPSLPSGWSPPCSGDLCLADVAIDCDFPFYQTFGSNFSLAQDIAAFTLNVANLQYERELHIRHRLTATLVRTSAASEPAGYASSTGTGQLLDAFVAHWNASQGGITRDLAHLLTGRHGGAGLAYVGVTCSNPGFSYGLSSLQFNLFGGTSGIGCYANVMAHELGHNWGAGHCGCTSPPFTMNAFYRPCPLRFGATSVAEIDAWRDANSGCLSSSVYNDDAAYALEVNNGTLLTDSNIGASTDGSVSCGFGGNPGTNDVWYFYRPAASGTLAINTCNAGTSFDTIISIHTAAPGTSANQIGCNDDSCGGSGLQSNTSAAVTAGQTYWIRVAGYNGATGTFVLNVVGPATRVPMNETSAMAMDAGPGNYYGTTVSATDDGNSSCAGASSPDVWFRYTPYSGEFVTFSTFGSLYDTVLTVFNAAGTTELFCNDDAPAPFGTLQSFIEFAPTPGTSYLIRVGGFGTASGGFVLHISGPDSFNSLCSNALSIPAGTRFGSFQGVFASDGASGCPNDHEPDLYYSFVAPSAGTLVVSTCGTHDLDGIDTGPDTVVSLHSSCPATAGNQLGCSDDNGACGTLDTSTVRDSFVSATVSSGQNVRIRVSRYDAFQGRKPFKLNVTLRPPNDDCGSALAIGNGTFNGTLAGATLDGSDNCVGANETDVWYLYTATCTGTLNVTTCGTHDTGGLDLGTDTVLSLHTGCPGTAGNLVACNDDSLLCGTLDQSIRRDSNVTLPVTPGQQVRIRVANYPGTPRSTFVLRTTCSTGITYCWGDGVAVACPCGNNSSLGAGVGCLNSLAVGGRLLSSGTPSIASDSVVLNGSQMATVGTCLYFQGSAAAGGGFGSIFGDGLRCAAGTIIRLGTKTNAGGASSYPTGGDPSVHVRGLVASPGTRYYQTWYRNSAAFCTSDTFNLTNGFQIHWLP